MDNRHLSDFRKPGTGPNDKDGYAQAQPGDSYPTINFDRIYGTIALHNNQPKIDSDASSNGIATVRPLTDM